MDSQILEMPHMDPVIFLSDVFINGVTLILNDIHILLHCYTYSNTLK